MTLATLRVTPIAWTQVDVPELADLAPRIGSGSDLFEQDIDILHEFAGRACYQSFHKPNPATAANKDYLANTNSQGHFSILEHGSVTFYIEGVSRSLTHELIRHRHLSYSELSQRYVNVEEASIVLPPALEGSGAEESLVETTLREARTTYGEIVRFLEGKGLKRKRAREAARAVMPNMTETKIVVTGNIRAWRDVLTKRYHVAADAEIQRFATEVLKHLRELAPNSVADLPDMPYGTVPLPQVPCE